MSKISLQSHYHCIQSTKSLYSKACVNSQSEKDRELVFKTNYCLMQVKSIAECSNGSILQYFQPSLSYQLSLRPLLCLFLSGRLGQVLLYIQDLSSHCISLKVFVSKIILQSHHHHCIQSTKSSKHYLGLVMSKPVPSICDQAPRL